MALILPPPETQFNDANGVPYAAGQVFTYVVGTDTPKNTWQDEAGDILNTNPIILDASGRCLLLGDGDYRIVLKDQYGNLIYDQWTSSVVSAAMLPVVSGSIANAKTLLGIGDITGETNRALAAEANLQTQINNEITRAENAENTLQNNINTEATNRYNGDVYLQNQINRMSGSGGTGAPPAILPAGYSMQFGSVASATNGSFSVTFSPAFPTTCDSVVVTGVAFVPPVSGPGYWCNVASSNAAGFSGVTSSIAPNNSGPIGVNWIAIGH
jgi:hypothetical protein